MEMTRSTADTHQMRTMSHSWHGLEMHEVLSTLDAKEEGLQTGDVETRRTQFGANIFSERKRRGMFGMFFSQAKAPLAVVLVIAFLITAILQEYIDAGVIAFAFLITVVVGVFQEEKASRAFEKLSSAQKHIATVFRDGSKHEIEASQLVVGDVIVLQSGMQVPADVRLLKTKNLSINEAALTGEWLAVDKHIDPVSVGTPLAERTNMGFMGTYVAEGYGLGVVVEVGDRTALGNILTDMQVITETETPLQAEMAKLSRVMLFVIISLVITIFAIGIFQGQSLHDMLFISIAIAVASIPEGLPAAVTIILAIGMESLLRRGGLVRNLLAAETLGSTTYILTDKTGTLTKADMEVTGIIHHGAIDRRLKEWQEDPSVRFLFESAVCASDAYVDAQEEVAVLRGDPVEQAFLKVGHMLGIDESLSSLRAARTDFVAFSSDTRYAAGLADWGGESLLCVNGAPNLILDHASSVLTDSGEEPFTQEEKKRYESLIRVETEKGKRLVSVAYKKVAYRDIPTEADAVLDALVFAGVVILDDPVREGVREAIAGVRAAGAEVLLITGDNPQTAFTIALETGITDEHGGVLTGDELEQLTDEEIPDLLHTIKVFARVLPHQKMRIVEILQKRGEIVAMTGDGINDAPALRRAHIGVAIGAGTEVAKESSDLVLVNNTFETIYAAIEEGRRIVANLRKIVGYLLSTSLTEVVLVGSAMVVGAATPILPAQILWANIIEEGLMSVAFAFEKGEKNAMQKKPQDIHEEGILSRHMVYFMSLVVIVSGTLIVILYFYLRRQALPLDELRSVMFLTVAMDSLFMAFAFRSLMTPVWKIPFGTNKFFLGSFLISLILLATVLSIPFFQHILSYTPVGPFYLLLAVGFSFASLMTVEIGKWLLFERRD